MIKSGIVILILIMAHAASAQIQSTSQHGTNCMSANLAQGQLLSWNRKGLSNNFSAPLWVICPVPLEHAAITAGATKIIVDVDWYLPPTYSGDEGPLCVFRIVQTGFGSPNLFFYNNLANRGFLQANGTQGFSSANNFDLDITFNTTPGMEDSLISGHVLCQVPQGSDLISYSIRWE